MNTLAGSPFAPPRNPNLVAGMLALGVHVVFVLLLVFGVSWQTQHPAPVMVDLWEALPKAAPSPAPQPPKTHKPAAKEPPLPERRDADIALEKKKAKAEELKKQQAAEEKVRAELARAEAEAMKKIHEKQVAELKKRELLRQMEEEDLKQRMTDEAAANAARQAKLAEAQARQAEARAAASRQQAEVASAVGQYRDMISAKVRGNTRLPDNLKGNPEVRCLVRLLPTGEVLSVRVTQSSGNTMYDDAVVRAIEKSSPLPLPSDRNARAAFVPELSFVHRPKE